MKETAEIGVCVRSSMPLVSNVLPPAWLGLCLPLFVDCQEMIQRMLSVFVQPDTSRGCDFHKCPLQAAPRPVIRRSNKRAENLGSSPHVHPGDSVAAGSQAVVLGARIQPRGPNLRPGQCPWGRPIHLLLLLHQKR